MTSPWVTTKDLLKYLGCSNSTLLRNLDSLKEGTHWRRRNPKSATAPRMWHLQKVEAYFCVPVSRR